MAKFNYFKKKVLVKRNSWSEDARANKKQTRKKYFNIKQAMRSFKESKDFTATAPKPGMFSNNSNTAFYSLEELHRQGVLDFIQEQLHRLERTDGVRFGTGIENFSEQLYEEISAEIERRGYESFTISVDEYNHNSIHVNFDGGMIPQVNGIQVDCHINLEGGILRPGSPVELRGVYG